MGSQIHVQVPRTEHRAFRRRERVTLRDSQAC
jgi:hypothetical protein